MVECICVICKKSFPSKQSLLAHYSTHKSDLFSCGECSKTFKHQSNLTAHKKLHIGDISCPFCDKSFQRKDYLKIHFIRQDYE